MGSDDTAGRESGEPLARRGTDARFGQGQQFGERNVQYNWYGPGRPTLTRPIEELGRSGLNEADPYQLGVYESTLATRYQTPGASRPPYVPRAQDGELTRLLTQRKLVLVVGRSRAGKSRSAFEVAASALPEHRLVVPRNRTELLQLASFDPPPWGRAAAVIWLDELENYLLTETDDGLDAALLAHLEQTPGVIVLATMRSEERDARRRMPGELGQRIRRALDRFQPATVVMPVDFEDPHEQRAIARLYPGLPTSRLAEHLAAVPELRRKLDDADQVQHALVRAAVDWRRAGLDRPATRDDLWALAESTLAARGRLPQVAVQDRARLNSALAWACEPVADTAALLERHSEPAEGYRATDPIVDYLADQVGPRLSNPAAWEILLARTGSQEMLKLATAAWSLEAPSHIANRALTAVVRDAEPAMAIAIAETLWNDSQSAGDPDLAEAVHRRLLDHHDGWLVAKAARRLVEVDPPAATVALRSLLDHRDAELVAFAAEWLVELDPSALRRLLDHPDPRLVSFATRWLAKFDPDGTRDALRKLLNHDDPEIVARAVGGLAQLDPDGARDALQDLLGDIDRESGARIAEYLLDNYGPEAEFEEILEDAEDSEIRGVIGVAEKWLGVEGWKNDHLDRDRMYFHSSPDRELYNPDPDAAVEAAERLIAWGLYEAGDSWRRLLRHVNPEVVVRAAKGLVEVDPEGAQDDLRELLHHRDTEVVVCAADRLVEMNPELAQEDLRRLLDHQDPRVVSDAARRLAALDLANAGQLWRQLLDDRDPGVVLGAAERLVDLDPYGAQDDLRRLLNHQDPKVMAEAAWRLAALDPAAAGQLWRQLLDDRDPGVVLRAAERLAALDPGAAGQLWRQLLDHPSPQVIAAATKRLAGLAQRH